MLKPCQICLECLKKLFEFVRYHSHDHNNIIKTVGILNALVAISITYIYFFEHIWIQLLIKKRINKQLILQMKPYRDSMPFIDMYKVLQLFSQKHKSVRIELASNGRHA
mgnify:CR=1 FL=1